MSLQVSIKKKLGAFYLDVEFENDGGVLALLGASGSGKSMTLKCVAGIETPDEGRIILDGRTLFDSEAKINLSPRRRGIGYLFQNYALFPNMTVRQNIESGIRGNREQRRTVSDEKINQLYLAGLEDKYPHQLSGGQQQRVALARILASSPEMILLDEPFSALDSYLQWQLEMELVDALQQFGGMALYVSHSRDEVYRVCDNVCVINDGKSEAVAPVRELFQNPGTLSAALLSGCKNYTAIEKRGERSFAALDWGVTLASGREISDDIKYAGIRAHHVRLAGDGDEKNTVECSVARVTEELFGMTAMLRPTASTSESDFSKLRLETSKEEWRALGGAETVTICLDPEAILLLR